MKTTRVMLLIDADNVSVDVMEQAVSLLLQRHGALHLRRAYCTAEGAVKHQAVFKRLGIRPMVNLAAGKNSTDIALAVDAIDLVLAERPDVVVIASSDSDFAPLVSRLREKGCRVEGIGQQGKTGEETRQAYDAFTVLEHGLAAKKTGAAARKSAARGTAAQPTARARAEPTGAVEAVAQTRSIAPAPAPDPAAAPAPARAATARAARGGGRAGAGKKAAAATKPAPAAVPARSSAPAPAVAAQASDKLAAIREHLPELAGGGALELRVVAERLRKAGLLGPKASVTRLLAAHADALELEPAGQPNRVRLRGARGTVSKR